MPKITFVNNRIAFRGYNGFYHPATRLARLDFLHANGCKHIKKNHAFLKDGVYQPPKGNHDIFRIFSPRDKDGNYGKVDARTGDLSLGWFLGDTAAEGKRIDRRIQYLYSKIKYYKDSDCDFCRSIPTHAKIYRDMYCKGLANPPYKRTRTPNGRGTCEKHQEFCI